MWGGDPTIWHSDPLQRIEDGVPQDMLHEAAAEIERLRGLIAELLPFMVNDVMNGMKMGPAPLGHVDDCQDCLWYESSLGWSKRLNQGEFDEFGIHLTD